MDCYLYASYLFFSLNYTLPFDIRLNVSNRKKMIQNWLDLSTPNLDSNRKAS